MALYIVQGNLDADGAITPPAPTAYAMYFEAGAKVAFADSYTELLTALVPGYDAVPDATCLALRDSLARTLAPLIQSSALDEELPESTQGLMLDLHAAYSAGTASEESLASWRASGPVAPLVAICARDEDHHHSLRADTSEDIWWVCPATAEALILSLHTYGIVKLMEKDED